MNIPGVWESSFVVDGRTPLGLWEGGIATLTESRGHCLEVPADQQNVEWIIDLGKQARIDHLILFPCALPELSGPGVMPPRLKAEIASNPEFDGSVCIASNGARDIPIDLTTPVILSA